MEVKMNPLVNVGPDGRIQMNQEALKRAKARSERSVFWVFDGSLRGVLMQPWDISQK